MAPLKACPLDEETTDAEPGSPRPVIRRIVCVLRPRVAMLTPSYGRFERAASEGRPFSPARGCDPLPGRPGDPCC